MKSILLFFISLIILSCKHRSIDKESFSITNSMYIPVMICGQKYNFLFDTGAEVSIIATRHAESLELKYIDDERSFKAMNGYTGQKYDAKLTKPTKLTICGVSIKRSLLCSDTNLTTKIDGIIGHDIIKQLYWMFDLSKQQFSVSTKPILDTIQQDEDLVLPYKSNSKGAYMLVDLSINGSDPMEYLFDTGCAICVFLDNSFFVDLIWGKDILKYQPEEIHKRLNAKSIAHITFNEEIPSFDNKFRLMDSVKVNAKDNMALFCATSSYLSANLIGLGFIQYFDRMYIDPFKQEIILIKYRQDKDGKSIRMGQQYKKSSTTSRKKNVILPN